MSLFDNVDLDTAISDDVEKYSSTINDKLFDEVDEPNDMSFGLFTKDDLYDFVSWN